MTEFRSVLERAGTRAPTPDLQIEPVLRRRDRKRRNQRIAAGVVGIAVFVSATWLVTTGGPFDRTEAPTIPGGAGTGRTGPPPDPIGVGLIGLPPEGAASSTPERGELVVGFVFGHTIGDPGVFSLNVYGDGRVIWRQVGWSNIPSTGWVEQHLTPEGMELIRSELLSTGLFDGDLHLASGRGLIDGVAEVRDGDRLDRITWGGGNDYDGPTTWPTPEQANTLKQLDTRLRDLPSWLPSSAWEDQEPKTFVPTRYAICYATGPGVGLDQVLDSVPRSAAEVLRSLDRTHEVSDSHGPTGTGVEMWCSTMTTDEARTLAGILDDADTADSVFRDVFGLHYKFGQQHPGALNVDLWFRPMLPHEP